MRFYAVTRPLTWHALVLRLIAVAAFSLATAARPTTARMTALPTDGSADRLLGQPDCSSTTANNPQPPIGGLSARSLHYPYAVAIDPGSGRLYVADSVNHRVLSWPSAAGFRLGQPADMVLGQPNFITNTALLTPTASSLNNPIGLAVDSAGGLYVADQLNHRVLFFQAPATTDTIADRVYGQQGNYNTRQANRGGLSAGSLNAPRGVAVVGNEWVVIADTGNNRVLLYPATTVTANRVIGQSSAITNTAGTSISHLKEPVSVALEGQSYLYVADMGNNRVLRFDDPFGGDRDADQVLGHTDYVSDAANRGEAAPAANSLAAPAGLALDGDGHLLAADSLNNRVLVYANAAALGNGAAASQVFGQPNFTSGEENNGGPSAASLAFTNGVTVDSAGNVYVADSGNHRLVAYDAAARTGCHMAYLPAFRR